MLPVAKTRALTAVVGAIVLAIGIPAAQAAGPDQPAAQASPVAQCPSGLIRVRDGRRHWKRITPDEDDEPAALIAP